MGSHFFVILSEAKNLVGKAHKAEILRFAQNDKQLNGDCTPQCEASRSAGKPQRALFYKDKKSC